MLYFFMFFQERNLKVGRKEKKVKIKINIYQALIVQRKALEIVCVLYPITFMELMMTY